LEWFREKGAALILPVKQRTGVTHQDKFSLAILHNCLQIYGAYL
jgi:hypothetical protein